MNMMNLSATSSEIAVISLFSDEPAIEERKSDPQDFATLQASLEMSTDQQIEKIVLNNPSFKLPLSVMTLKFQQENLNLKRSFEVISN